MIERKYGKIIQIASLAAITGIPHIPAYTAAKGGIASMTYQLAIDWAPLQHQHQFHLPGVHPDAADPAVEGKRAGNLHPEPRAGRTLGRTGGYRRYGRVPGRSGF